MEMGSLEQEGLPQFLLCTQAQFLMFNLEKEVMGNTSKQIVIHTRKRQQVLCHLSLLNPRVQALDTAYSEMDNSTRQLVADWIKRFLTIHG